jgi:hypothetical protein
MNLMSRLWNDQAGFIISTELMIVATILVIGILVGLVAIREQIVQELADIAMAISDVNQSYSFAGVTGHTSSTAGSDFLDQTDFCDVAPSQAVDGNFTPSCVNVNFPASEEGP